MHLLKLLDGHEYIFLKYRIYRELKIVWDTFCVHL